MEVQVYHGCGHVWARAAVQYPDHWEMLEAWMYIPDLHYPEYRHFMTVGDLSGMRVLH